MIFFYRYVFLKRLSFNGKSQASCQPTGPLSCSTRFSVIDMPTTTCRYSEVLIKWKYVNCPHVLKTSIQQLWYKVKLHVCTQTLSSVTTTKPWISFSSRSNSSRVWRELGYELQPFLCIITLSTLFIQYTSVYSYYTFCCSLYAIHISSCTLHCSPFALHCVHPVHFTLFIQYNSSCSF